MPISQITNAAANEQVRQLLQYQFSISPEYYEQILRTALLLAGTSKKNRKRKELNDFHVNNQFVKVTRSEAEAIHERFRLLYQTPSQLMELTGAQVEIVRSRLPGLYGVKGIMYYEAADFIALCDEAGRCYRISKKQVDWTSQGVYFVGRARSYRYKRLKVYSM